MDRQERCLTRQAWGFWRFRKNGKQIIFALFGVLYRLTNGDISETDLINDRSLVRSQTFTYGAFISNYKANDIDEKLKQMTKDVVTIVTEAYENAFENKQATSVSNYFKTDSKYLDQILKKFTSSLSMITGKDIKAQMDILKRQKYNDH